MASKNWLTLDEYRLLRIAVAAARADYEAAMIDEDGSPAPDAADYQIKIDTLMSAYRKVNDRMVTDIIQRSAFA